MWGGEGEGERERERERERGERERERREREREREGGCLTYRPADKHACRQTDRQYRYLPKERE